MITPTSMTDKERRWVYLSPHLDDVALSCGGLIWEQTHSGTPVNIWTICAGDPPDGPLSPFAEELHQRWQTGREAVYERRREDQCACACLGAEHSHLLLPDCIYRKAPGGQQFLYASEQAIFGTVNPLEGERVNALNQALSDSLPAQANLVIPLTLGGHVDHRLTRMAAEQIQRPGLQLWYYADYPYAIQNSDQLALLHQAGWNPIIFSVSPAGLAAWQAAVYEHTSQISTFWPNLEATRVAIRDYCMKNNGVQLWKAPPGK